jgi:hypothetical protein
MQSGGGAPQRCFPAAVQLDDRASFERANLHVFQMLGAREWLHFLLSFGSEPVLGVLLGTCLTRPKTSRNTHTRKGKRSHLKKGHLLIFASLGSSYTTEKSNKKLSFEESIFFFFRFLDFLKLDFVLVSFTDDPLAAHDKTGHSEKSIFLTDDQFAAKVDFTEMGLFMLQTKNMIEKRGLFG